MKSALFTLLTGFFLDFKLFILLRTEGRFTFIDFTALYALLTLYIGPNGTLMFIFALIFVWNGKALEKAFHANLGVKENIGVLAAFWGVQGK